MNQRAVSAPQPPMISVGSTVFFFDFDIFSMPPISTVAPPSFIRAVRLPSSSVISISAGETQPSGPL